MRARDLGAAVLLLAVVVAPALPAQSNPEREQLRRELKERVDRALIEAMRSLRRELHAMIDEELDGTAAWPPPGALEDDAPGVGEPSAALQACAARLARLRKRLGDDHPEVLQLEADLSALGRGVVPPSFRYLTGVKLVPASEELRARFLLPAGVGLTVATIPEGSPFAVAGVEVGDVLVYTSRGAVRSRADLEAAFRGLPPGAGLRTQIIRHRDGRRSFVSLPAESAERASGDVAIPEIPEFSDPRAVIDEMLQRAIRQVVPAEGGMIIPGPPSSPEGGALPPEPAKRKQLDPGQ